MEGDSLYSVKWYKGRREFYRYSPKENPAMKTFPIAGVHVVVSSHEALSEYWSNQVETLFCISTSFQQTSSNESQLVLSNVLPVTSGKFSCEVSADFPSFHTMIVSGDMEVVGKLKLKQITN